MQSARLVRGGAHRASYGASVDKINSLSWYNTRTLWHFPFTVIETFVPIRYATLHLSDINHYLINWLIRQRFDFRRRLLPMSSFITIVVYTTKYSSLNTIKVFLCIFFNFGIKIDNTFEFNFDFVNWQRVYFVLIRRRFRLLIGILFGFAFDSSPMYPRRFIKINWKLGRRLYSMSPRDK